ncbi:MAG: UDP-N-acetylglucosamine--N-acetylmuramyl-(pentapeptide) pyrophosphoryl-undecaprenol N-acetylglucosamine transferase [bacterium]|nr:UDP-N-acetylglucosamine--N-acetylmuramyl-(pentapeptide) pyrophosphoryl-undecaprenol N-acetylglucosamine transferase [bacterium]
MKILFTGGGTGGHVVPIIAIVREIKKIYLEKDLQFFFLGPKDEVSSTLLSQEGIKVKTILAGKIRRYISGEAFFQNLIDICIKIPIGILQSFFYIFFLSPDLIFSKGGFGSIPGVLAGKLLFVPIFLHESDTTPGFANKFLRGFALEIFASFPKTECFSLKKLILVGNPIRRELLKGSKEEAKSLFKLNSRAKAEGKEEDLSSSPLVKPVILILGGSQGAQRINDEILEILPRLLENFEVIHQCGKNNYATIKAELKLIINKDLEPFYHLYPFLKESELRQAYAAADLIVSRAGSGSIFEIAAVGKPSVLIPLSESAQNHQVKNAYTYQESGACLVMEENNFTSHFFLEKLKSLFTNPEALKKMSEEAKGFSRPEAGWIIANYLVAYLTR